MSRFTRYALIASGMLFAALPSGCLPENFWANKWGEILNGLIIDAVDLIVGPIFPESII